MIPQKIIKYPSVAKSGDGRMFIDFLEKAKVKYEPIEHRIVYTAFDKAQTLKVSEKMVGKTLILKTDKGIFIALIATNKNLDTNKLKKIAKAKKIGFVSEKVIKNKFKGVKVGAIPPFGNLWGLLTFIDGSLTNQPKIIINGGDHNFSIKISPAAFKKIIPDLIIGNFSKPRGR